MFESKYETVKLCDDKCPKCGETLPVKQDVDVINVFVGKIHYIYEVEKSTQEEVQKCLKLVAKRHPELNLSDVRWYKLTSGGMIGSIRLGRKEWWESNVARVFYNAA